MCDTLTRLSCFTWGLYTRFHEATGSLFRRSRSVRAFTIFCTGPVYSKETPGRSSSVTRFGTWSTSLPTATDARSNSPDRPGSRFLLTTLGTSLSRSERRSPRSVQVRVSSGPRVDRPGVLRNPRLSAATTDTKRRPTTCWFSPRRALQHPGGPPRDIYVK